MYVTLSSELWSSFAYIHVIFMHTTLFHICCVCKYESKACIICMYVCTCSISLPRHFCTTINKKSCLRGIYMKHKFCVEHQKILSCDTNRTASISQIPLYDAEFVFRVNRPLESKLCNIISVARFLVLAPYSDNFSSGSNLQPGWPDRANFRNFYENYVIRPHFWLLFRRKKLNINNVFFYKICTGWATFWAMLSQK
jgi:hypothetical protein